MRASGAGVGAPPTPPNSGGEPAPPAAGPDEIATGAPELLTEPAAGLPPGLGGWGGPLLQPASARASSAIASAQPLARRCGCKFLIRLTPAPRWGALSQARAGLGQEQLR